MKTKRCSKCGKAKSTSEFYRKCGHGDGFQNQCKECTKARIRLVKSPVSVASKKCKLCEVEKPASEFYRDAQLRSGLHSRCKACVKLGHTHSPSEAPKLCLDCGATKPASEFSKSKQQLDGLANRCKRCVYFGTLVRKYSLSLETHRQMLKEQDNKCAICGDPFIETPHVDHCHVTNKVRGLLCSNCNGAIGCAKDDPTILTNAIKYLEVNDE